MFFLRKLQRLKSPMSTTGQGSLVRRFTPSSDGWLGDILTPLIEGSLVCLGDAVWRVCDSVSACTETPSPFLSQVVLPSPPSPIPPFLPLFSSLSTLPLSFSSISSPPPSFPSLPPPHTPSVILSVERTSVVREVNSSSSSSSSSSPADVSEFSPSSSDSVLNS